MGYKNIEDRRAYHRQYMQERREWFVKHNCCSECGKQDAYTIGGKRRCFDCTEKEKHKKMTDEQRELHNKKEKERYYKRKENGICTECGRKAEKGFAKCLRCLIKDRNRHKSDDVPRHERGAYGLCYICGKELNGQKNVDGKDSKLCKSCYQKMKKWDNLRPLYPPIYNTKAAWENYFKLKANRELMISAKSSQTKEKSTQCAT